MLLRRLEAKDVEPAINVIRGMIEEGSSFEGIRFLPCAVRTWLRACVDHPSAFYCEVVEENGLLKGGFMGKIEPFAFSGASFALEVGIYLQPSVRGGRIARNLVTNFEKWAKSQNCNRVQTAVSLGANDELACNLYRRLGYSEAGHIFRKEI